MCKLDGGEIYLGESDFQLVKDCIHYNCRCNCDGSWNCPGERARRICNADGSPLRERTEEAATTTATATQPTSACRRCVVSDAERFLPNQPFTLRRGCNEYRCQCECDGSWNCPADRSRNVCGRRDEPELRSQTCASCRVSSYVYPGSSSFLLTRGCSQYACKCDCSGRWSCNHTVARNICQDGDGDGRGGFTSSGRAISSGVSSGVRRTSASSFSSVSSATSRRRAQNTIASNTQQRAVSTTRGSSVSAANLGSYDSSSSSSSSSSGRPGAACTPCRVEGREYPPERDFVLQKKCRRFNCFCSCNGRWRCPRERVENLCPEDSAPSASSPAAAAAVPSRTAYSAGSRQGYVSSSSSSRGAQNRGGGRAISVYRGADGRQYGRTNIRVVGADTAASSSSSFSSSSSSSQAMGRDEQDFRRMNVHGYYVDSEQRQQSYGQADNTRAGQTHASQYRDSGTNGAATTHAQTGVQARRQNYGQTDQAYSGRQAGVQTGQAYGQMEHRQGTRYSQGSDERSRHHYQMNARAQQGYADNAWGQNARYSQGRSHSNTQAVSSAAVSSSHGTKDEDSASASASSVVSVASEGSQTGAEEGGNGNSGAGTCTPCQVDEKIYQTGAKFNWRRGCVVYKCTCMCSGSYRCRLSVDPDCSEEEATPGAGGLPTGPAQRSRAANKPGGTCGNCYVHGFVYPGNMSFTLRQGCQELSCRCGCDGSHECSDRKPIPGCTAVSTPLSGAIYPYGAAPAVYPVGGGGYAVRPGRVISAYQQSFYSVDTGSAGCLSCNPAGRGVLMPALVAAQPQPSRHSNGFPKATQPQVPYSPQSHLTYPGQYVPQSPQLQPQPQPQPQPARARGRTSVQMVSMQPVPVSDSARQDSMVDKSCASCFVNGQSHRGSFEYTKDCYQVTCYCDCSGWLRCSVQPAMTPECPPQYGPVSGRCRSCVVQGHEYPPSLQFALRVGCYGYDCSCGCDGLWMCPTQQPSNYCVRPASPPPGVGMDDEDHSYHRRRYNVLDAGAGLDMTAELKDRTYSRSAEDEEEPDASALSSTAAGPADEKDEEEDEKLNCRDCEVRGATYPARSRFLLRDGCLQHTCDCACDGSWACPKNATVDVCRERSQEEEEQVRRQSREEQILQQKQRALAEVAAHKARMAAGADDSCRSCSVNGKHYLTNSDFRFRRGCHLFTCRCFCNGSWECPASKTRDLCSSSDYGGNGCRQCHLNNKTYPGGAAFTYREGCWEFSCRCGCSGEATCPSEDTRNLCVDGVSVPSGQGASQALTDSGSSPPSSHSCKPCMVDGQVIR